MRGGKSIRRRRTAGTLMAAAIIALAGFLGYWLYTQYRTERERFRVRVDVLLTGAVQQVQSARIKAVVGHEFDRENLPDLPDSPNAAIRILRFERHQPGGLIVFNRRVPNGAQGKDTAKSFRILMKTVQDPISLYSADSSFRRALARDQLALQYVLRELVPGKKPNDTGVFAHHLRTGAIYVPGAASSAFQAAFPNAGAYIFQRMLSPTLFSFFLLALEIVAFLFIYRNMARQERLVVMKDQLVSNITHELKTPVATVSVAIEALRDFEAWQDGGKRREYLDISVAELQRLSLLVDKVLRLSLFEEEGVRIEHAPVRIDSIVNEIVAAMRIQLDRVDARTDVRMEGADFVVQGDRQHLESVVYNLLDNAIKYGGPSPAISIVLAEHLEDIELEISDRGPGIPDRYKSKIFGRFFRIPSGDRHEIKGYGLGLSYVRQIVSLHHGTIRVTDNPGGGARFVVRLPAALKSSEE